MSDTIQQRDLSEQEQRAQHEYHPTLKFVQESLCRADAPMLDHQADRADAPAVHENAERHAGQENHDPLPKRALVKVRHQKSQGHQREQVAQPAACLRDLQLVAAEVDDVALEKNADIEQTNEK